MKKLLILFYFVFITINAQTKSLTMEDVVLNSYYSLSPKDLQQLNWISGTNNYYYINSESQSLDIFAVNNDKPFSSISLTEFNVLLNKENVKNLNRFPRLTSINKNTFYFVVDSVYLVYDFNQKEIVNKIILPSNCSNLEVDNSSKAIAYTIDNNLFYTDSENKTVQISSESNKNILFGQSVHRNEFGITKGIFWSPQNNYLAFYRMDQTMVTDYPILDLSSLPATVEYDKYPMAGGKSHEVTIGIYNLKTNKTVYLETGLPKDQYLTCVTWSPDEKYVFVALLNRDQNHYKLVKYDATNGKKAKVLFEENNSKFVEPENPLIFIDDSHFLWFSKRDGYNHLYEYDINGNLVKQITKGTWEVTDYIGFSSKTKNLFYISTEQSPLERHLYCINMESLNKKQLTTEEGTHQIVFNDEYFFDKFSSLSIPRVISLYKNEGSKVKDLLISDNPVKEYLISYPKLLTIKNEGMPDLYARLILPTNFDSTKKYPVIVYVYGGPHSQEVSNRWIWGRYDFWFQYMAEKGYIVFTVDNRGTSFRGLEFEQATFRQLGSIEVEDQMRGVNYLKTLSYVDSTRFGAYGWSYGGFMTTSLMLRTNNTFKVGVGGGAVIDWKYYEVMYTERYMDTPQSNPDGFNNSNLLNYVNNLNGKLLLVHGTSDNTVVWQHTLLFTQKATSLNKALDYFPYVHHTHGVSGKDALHLYNKISNYFLNNL